MINFKKFLNNSFINNAISVFGFKILCYIVTFFASIYLANLLGPTGKGKLAVITSVSGMVIQFGNMGMHSSNTYYISKDRNKIKYCEGNIIILIILSIIIIPIGITYFSINGNLLNLEPFFLIIAFLLVPFNMFIMLQENLFIASDKVKYFNILEILNNGLYFILLILSTIIFPLDITTVVISMLLAGILISVYSIIAYFRQVEKNIKISIKFFLDTLPYGLKSYCACLMAYLVLRVDVFMLNYYTDDYNVGIYSLAVNLVDMSYMVSSSISIILFPKLSTLRYISERKALVKKVLLVSTPILFFIYFIMAVFARFVINLLYGEQFIEAVPVLYILIPGAFCWATANYFCQFFASENKLLPTIIVPTLALIVNVILNYKLIPISGIRGTAFASTFSYLICLICMLLIYYFYTKRLQKESI